MLSKNNFLLFPGVHIRAIYKSRPQRFLAEVSLSAEETTFAYCANPGSLHGCLKAGSAAILLDSGNEKRKRRYTLRAIKLGRTWIGTDTHFANRIVENLIEKRFFKSLSGYLMLQKEPPINGNSRFDFLLSGKKGKCFIEVKSATIVENKVARFPDSITPRGLKHLRLMEEQALLGHKTVLIFVVQRSDASYFTVNDKHPAYTAAFKQAIDAGMEVYAVAVNVSLKGIGNPKLLEIID